MKTLFVVIVIFLLIGISGMPGGFAVAAILAAIAAPIIVAQKLSAASPTSQDRN